MKRMKLVCLVMSAAALSCVLSASSALAGPIDLACTTDAECFLKGDQIAEGGKTIELKANAGVIKCTEAHITADTAAALGGTTVTTEVGGGADWAIHGMTVVPTYGGCTGFGQIIDINMNGCVFNLTVTSGATDEPGPYVTGTATIACPAGKSVVMTGKTTKCTVTIGAQTPANNVIDVYNESSGATADIKVRSTVGNFVEGGGITYTSTGGSCGKSGTNATIRGEGTNQCYSDAARTKQIGCTLVETVEATESKKIKSLP